MIKGTRIQGTNSVNIGIYSGGLSTAVPILSLPTGKTFILTDLVCGFTMSDMSGSGMALPGVAMIDGTHVGGTAATVGEFRFVVRPKMQGMPPVLTDVTPDLVVEPLVITDMVNGPEFSTQVSAANLATWNIPTFGLWIGGVLR